MVVIEGILTILCYSGFFSMLIFGGRKNEI